MKLGRSLVASPPDFLRGSASSRQTDTVALKEITTNVVELRNRLEKTWEMVMRNEGNTK